MLLQEFNYVIKNGKGSENPLIDHLSSIVATDACEFLICD